MPILNYLAQEKNIQHTIRIVCFINCCLYKEWVFTKKSLHMVLSFLINCICCHHGHFPSLYVFTTMTFQNFSVGVFISVFYSLMSCFIFKDEILDIYIRIILIFIEVFCGELQYLFLPNDRFILFGFLSNLV